MSHIVIVSCSLCDHQEQLEAKVIVHKMKPGIIASIEDK